MKWKSLIWTLGIQPKPKTYGTELVQFELSQDGTVAFHKWLHPKDYFRPFEQAVVDELRTFIKPGDTVLDIGAHCGDFSIPLALASGKAGCVFAWEPNPYVFEVLQKNSLLNREKTNIVPVQAAAGETEGELEFNYSDPGFCNGGCLKGISRWKHGHPYTLKVPAHRVVEWMLKNHPDRLSKLSFVKIDAEGFDHAVVRSLRDMLEVRHPTLHVEMYRHLNQIRREALWSELVELGYDVFHTSGAYGCSPGQRLERGDLCKWPHYDVLAIPA